MSYVLAPEGTVVRYPYNQYQLQNDNPDTSFPVSMTDESLAGWGVYPVTSVARPEVDPLQRVVEELPPEKVDGVWAQRWSTRVTTPEEQAQEMQRRVSQYETALDAHLDATAREKRYTDRFTCALRAGYPGPWQAEGAAFADWMDRCNMYAYTLMQDVLAGTRPPPASTEAFIAELPDMVWPA